LIQRLLVAALLAAIFIAPAQPVFADTTYTYQPSGFTYFNGGYSCPTPPCKLTASFSVSQPFGANITDRSFVPTSYSLSDGNATLTQSNSFPTTLASTDANGNLIGWELRAEGAGYIMIVCGNEGCGGIAELSLKAGTGACNTTGFCAIGSTPGQWTPLRRDQIIAFGTLPDRVLGQPPFMVSATASSSLPVAFGAAGSCTIAGNMVTLTAIGTCSITASQPGSDAWKPAPSVTQSFQVLTPAQFAQNLIAVVSSVASNAYIRATLSAPLIAYGQALAAGNRSAACADVAVFTAAVNSLTGAGLTLSQAQTLLGAAAVLAAGTGC
jgi:hypothetical protein